MSTDGKHLEALVAFVEETLVPKGFEVKPNRRVFDDEGKQVAEFDVEIRGKLGSTDIAWLIECRDRPASGSAPVGWIEQLVGRRERFRFSKVTAVSTTGFTTEAAKYALQSGIELREVKEISPEAFKPWLQLTHMECVVRSHNLIHATILVHHLESELHRRAAFNAIKTLDGNARFLRSTKNGNLSTAAEAFIGVGSNVPALWEGITPNDVPKRVDIHCIYDNDLDHFTMDTTMGAVRVGAIVFEGELVLVQSDIPAQTFKYANVNDGDSISEIAKFEAMAGQDKISVELHRIPESGYTHVLLRTGK